MTAAQRLAIDGNDSPAATGGSVAHPLQEDRLDGARAEQPKHAAERGMRGNLGRQVQKSAQPRFPDPSPIRRLSPGIGPRRDRAQGNRDQIDQLVLGAGR